MIDTNNSDNYSFGKIVDILIRLGVLLLLLMWCFDIVKPFVMILIWGGIIAIAIYPIFEKLARLLRNKSVLAAVIITVILISLIVIPAGLLFNSLFEGVVKIKDLYTSGQSIIPPPNESAKNWPAFAKPIVDLWKMASENIAMVISKYGEQLKEIGRWAFMSFTSLGMAIVQFLVSIIIAGVFLAFAGESENASKKIFRKLAGEQGDNYHNLSVVTIRNVVRGIIGVALIQTALASIGMFVAGVPLAGLWTVLCIVFAIAQIGVGPVVIPVVIYMYSVTDTMHASLLAGWMIIPLIIDNILKPIMLGRNAPVPMLIVFMGAIGGFIYSGFIGMFLGAVILSLGYKLITQWMNNVEISN